MWCEAVPVTRKKPKNASRGRPRCESVLMATPDALHAISGDFSFHFFIDLKWNGICREEHTFWGCCGVADKKEVLLLLLFRS